MQHLINDLLDVSKIKAGKLEFEKNVVDLTELINLCIENSSYMYPAYNIQQDVEENLMVSGNAERLEQVLMNLINNAVKYSPGKKDIIVRGSSENNCVTVSVIDKGIGLSDYSQKRVFERFYRAENKNSSFPGLGWACIYAMSLLKSIMAQ
ncbi:MAG: HAMP domain-containing sensor histidine kinase [Bacteroidota bacterium]